MTYVLAQYALNGTFLGLIPLASQLQVHIGSSRGEGRAVGNGAAPKCVARCQPTSMTCVYSSVCYESWPVMSGHERNPAAVFAVWITVFDAVFV